MKFSAPIIVLVIAAIVLLALTILKLEGRDSLTEVVNKIHECSNMGVSLNTAISESQQRDFLTEMQKDKKGTK